MIKGGGKKKGSSFEREICKKLSLWISEGEKDDVFWRSAMSGGRSTVGVKKGIKRSQQVGDISAIDVIGQKFIDIFLVECKFYKNIQLHSLLFGKPSKNSIHEFWTVLEKKAKEFYKEPMLIFKQNKLPVLIGLRGESWCCSLLADFRILPIAKFLNTDPRFYLYEFDKFLKITNPSILEIQYHLIK